MPGVDRSERGRRRGVGHVSGAGGAARRAVTRAVGPSAPHWDRRGRARPAAGRRRWRSRTRPAGDAPLRGFADRSLHAGQPPVPPVPVRRGFLVLAAHRRSGHQPAGGWFWPARVSADGAAEPGCGRRAAQRSGRGSRLLRGGPRPRGPGRRCARRGCRRRARSARPASSVVGARVTSPTITGASSTCCVMGPPGRPASGAGPAEGTAGYRDADADGRVRPPPQLEGRAVTGPGERQGHGCAVGPRGGVGGAGDLEHQAPEGGADLGRAALGEVRQEVLELGHVAELVEAGIARTRTGGRQRQRHAVVLDGDVGDHLGPYHAVVAGGLEVEDRHGLAPARLDPGVQAAGEVQADLGVSVDRHVGLALEARPHHGRPRRRRPVRRRPAAARWRADGLRDRTARLRPTPR